jgi:hypothetical protein
MSRVRSSLNSLTVVFVVVLILSRALAPGLHAAPIEVRITQQGTNVLLSWPTNYSAFDLQYSTNLSSTNWTVISGPVLQTNHFEVLQPIVGTTRYYRLLSPAGCDREPAHREYGLGFSTDRPYLPEGSSLVFNYIPSTNGTTTIFYDSGPNQLYTDPLFPFSTQIDPYSFIDASAVIDPATCDNSGLTYLWVIAHDTLGADLHPPGVSGYDTSRLQVTSQALPNGGYHINLFVTGVHGTSEFTFDFTVEDSTASFLPP